MGGLTKHTEKQNYPNVTYEKNISGYSNLTNMGTIKIYCIAFAELKNFLSSIFAVQIIPRVFGKVKIIVAKDTVADCSSFSNESK